jgi:hypothetical protein
MLLSPLPRPPLIQNLQQLNPSAWLGKARMFAHLPQLPTSCEQTCTRSTMISKSRYSSSGLCTVGTSCLCMYSTLPTGKRGFPYTRLLFTTSINSEGERALTIFVRPAFVWIPRRASVICFVERPGRPQLPHL